MKKLQVSVKTSKDARLLTQLLRSLKFVVDVEDANNVEKRAKVHGQFEELNALLTKHAGPQLFKHIKDPVQWQKDMRHEWE